MRIVFTIFLFFISSLFAAQAPNWQWANKAGGTAADNASGIATDNFGNIFVCGHYYSSVLSMGSTTLTNNGNYDFYLAKFDNLGNFIWAKSFGGNYDDIATGVSIDLSGNVFVTGSFISPTLAIAGYTLVNSGAGDIFLAKFDTNGNCNWAKKAGDGGSNQANAVTCTPAGNVVIAGSFNNPTLSFGTYTLTNNGNDDAFVASFDLNGNVNWAYSYGDFLSDVANGITSDVSGNIAITGFYKSPSLTINSYTLVNAGAATADLFVIKIMAGGTFFGAAGFGSSLDEIGYGVTTDNMGQIIVAGSFLSPVLSIGSSTVINNGTRDALIIKLNSNLTPTWAKGGGGSFDDYAYSIDANLIGNIVVSGHIHSPSAIFGAFNLNANGVGDGFIVAYDMNGNELWATSEGGTGDDGWNAIAIDGSGMIYNAGYFSSPSVSVGTFSFTTTGSADILFGKINGVTSVENINSISEAAFLYPNPASSVLFIRNLAIHGKYVIIDVFGKIVLEDPFQDNNTSIDVSLLPQGIFFVVFEGYNRRYALKFIKQ